MPSAGSFKKKGINITTQSSNLSQNGGSVKCLRTPRTWNQIKRTWAWEKDGKSIKAKAKKSSCWTQTKKSTKCLQVLSDGNEKKESRRRSWVSHKNSI